MSQLAVARVSVKVAVEPAVAFEVFTAEIDRWWLPGPHAFRYPKRAVAMRFEPWVGGRLIEVHDGDTGEGLEIARVTAWEPGQRLAWIDAKDSEVEVWFKPTDIGTLVMLEHRGLDKLDPRRGDADGRIGSRVILQWFESYIKRSAT
jgi:hypothetical protein